MLYNILTILLALAVSMTFFGKAIVGIVMAVVVIVSVMIIAQERRSVFQKNKITPYIFSKEKIAIIIMLGAWFYSAAQGIHPDKSIHQTLEFAGIIVGALIIFTGLSTQHMSFDRFIRWSVIPAAVCAAYLNLTPYIGEWAQDWRSSYGAVLAIIAPLAFYQSLKKPRQVKYWICLFLIVAAIFASGSRTAWVAFAAISVLFPFVFVWHGMHYRLAKIVLLAVMICTAAFAGLHVNKQVIGEASYEFRKERMLTLDRPASGRVEIWKNTIEKIEEQPIWGYGIKSAQSLNIEKAEGYAVLHTHNAVLEMLLETGIIGFLAITSVIIVFVGHFLISFFRSRDTKLRQQGAVILLACMAYGISSMALTSMFHAWWFLYLVILLILLKSAEMKLRQTK